MFSTLQDKSLAFWSRLSFNPEISLVLVLIFSKSNPSSLVALSTSASIFLVLSVVIASTLDISLILVAVSDAIALELACSAEVALCISLSNLPSTLEIFPLASEITFVLAVTFSPNRAISLDIALSASLALSASANILPSNVVSPLILASCSAVNLPSKDEIDADNSLSLLSELSFKLLTMPSILCSSPLALVISVFKSLSS